jgi:hypothetical protein
MISPVQRTLVQFRRGLTMQRGFVTHVCYIDERGPDGKLTGAPGEYVGHAVELESNRQTIFELHTNLDTVE